MKRTAILLLIILIAAQLNVFADTSILQNTVSESPGTSHSDWSAIALTVANEPFNKDAYITKLKDYVSEKYQSSGKLSPTKSTEWHRIAIAVNLLGYDATDFYGINLINDGIFYRENLGKQGLNGYIWALICLSSGNYNQPDDAINTKGTLLYYILSKQNSDGSFSLNGSSPSCDITAMAIYAMSFYKDKDEVKIAINNALGYLSSIQNQDGSFSENGVSNAESTAQVIIALSSLGEYANTFDFSRVYEALELFKTSGGYSHLQGGEVDIMATYQAVCARSSQHKAHIYSNYIKTEIAEIAAEPSTETETRKVSTSTIAQPTDAAFVKAEHETEIQTEKQAEIETETTIENYPTEYAGPTEAAAEISTDENNSLLLLIIPFILIAVYVIIRRKK